MSKNENIEAIEKEAVLGIVPVTKKEKQYGFMEAFLFLSSYGIATWNYTQGAYIATLVGFKQMLIAILCAAVFIMLIFELPVILSTRYGIDIWIWLKSVLGHRGVQIMTVLVVLLNFPWHAVCADIFASSMENLCNLFGFNLPSGIHPYLGVICVCIGGLIAFNGIGTVNLVTKILTPLLILVGIVVMAVGFTAAPVSAIINYVPSTIESGSAAARISYIIAVDGMFAFNLAWFGGMAGIPRLTKSEQSGYWGGIAGQAVTGSFFIIIGAVMAISMEYVTGEVGCTDPTLMLAKLAFRELALCSLLLVGFANIGTQATGSYLYAIMLKSAFKNISYRVLVIVLTVYVSGLCFWGKIQENLGVFLTIGACTFAPVAALLFADFFVVKKQKISLRAAFSINGNKKYNYLFGFNPVGVLSIIVGVLINLSIYDPLKGIVRIPFLFKFTPSACAFVGTALFYVLLNCIPFIRKYNVNDRDEITV